MQDRRPPRQIARELALLSLSQLPVNPKKLTEEQLPKLVLAAVRTLRAEVQDSLETASAELQRSNDRILTSQTRAADLNTARTMLQEAVGYTQVAINQLAATIDFPELIQLANQDRDVRQYAIELVKKVAAERQAIDDKISAALVDWQVMRLAQIDRDILRIAVGEMEFFDVPAKVAINEAVELAKRYSGEDGHRFINGVLRKVSDQNQLSINSEQLSMNNEL